MDQNQFIKLIEEHSGIIHTVINLYTDSLEDKEDLKQEILLQSWRSIGNFKNQSKFSTWLYRVSLNTSLTFLKKTKKQDEVITELISSSDIEENSQNMQSEALYLEVKKLDDIDRILITLHLEGYKNQEISEILSININHVGVKLHRIKEKIINNLKRK